VPSSASALLSLFAKNVILPGAGGLLTHRCRLLRIMTEVGLLNSGDFIAFFISAKGWLRVEELQSRRSDTSQAFVAMWFDDATEEPYRNGIYKAIYDSGFDPRRVDREHHHLNKVDDEIIAAQCVAGAGLRAAEVATLKVSNIDSKRMLIRVVTPAGNDF
jgi:integrase